MRNTLIALLAIILGCVLYSCTKAEESGSLPGFWQLMTVERNGEVSDVKSAKVYWAERRGLLQLTSPLNEEHPNLYAHVRESGDSLIIDDFCFPSEYASDADDDEWISFGEREVLFPWGIFACDDKGKAGRVSCAFRVIQMGETSMVLQSDSARLSFRRF